MFLHFDIETWSKADLTKVGTHAYFSHPTTEVLMWQWAHGDNDHVWVIDAGGKPRANPIPQHLLEALLHPETVIVAFNAEFERTALRLLHGIDIPPERWICTMALGWSFSFVGGLASMGDQMGIPQDKAKVKAAHKVMLKLTQPRKPSTYDTSERWLDYVDYEHLATTPGGTKFRKPSHYCPDDWTRFREYGRNDVEASRALFQWCVSRTPWPEKERAMWCLDQRINDAGWPIDTALVAQANQIRLAEESHLADKLQRHTGLKNPNSNSQMMNWLTDCGYPLPDLQKETVASHLDGITQMPKTVREALELMRQLKRATPKKWNALARGTVAGAIQATLEFGAAQRTQRWGGRMFQPQNLFSARGWTVEELETLAELILNTDHATLSWYYDDVMTALSAGIRGAVKAPPGFVLVVVDLASIESRILGWLSGCKRINDIFASGRDTYRDLATRIFNIPYDQVTKAQRTFCKPPDLGCGYMLGRFGLVEYAAGMGVEMTESEATVAVEVWRDANPEVCDMWEWQKNALHACTEYGTVSEGYRVRIRRDPEFLYIDLPSGRSIHYYKPAMREGRYGPSFSYMGRYNEGGSGGAWQRVYSHPGKTTENEDQAIARDVLRDAMLTLEPELPPDAYMCGHVHDEIVSVVREKDAHEVLALKKEVMSRTPAWAPGLILDAEGFITERYRKD